MSGLADALRARTQSLHLQAERSGVMRSILRRRADVHRYTLLLRNLWPVYAQLEQELTRHGTSAGIAEIAIADVYRAPAIAADLNALCGPSWRQSLPMLPAGERYVNRIVAAGRDDAARLVGHAYTRYLGDLNGGRILRRILAESLGLEQRALNFFAYPRIADLDRFRPDYRQAFDRAGDAIGRIDQVIDEACTAFRLNIELSNAVEKDIPESDAAD